METEIQINDEILKLTNKIKDTYPELLKYIGEMPVKISYTSHSLIDINNLKDYYDSLSNLLNKYNISHLKKSLIKN